MTIQKQTKYLIAMLEHALEYIEGPKPRSLERVHLQMELIAHIKACIQHCRTSRDYYAARENA
jgi:hypothetical protein